MIRLEHIRKEFGTVVPIADVNYTFEKGRIYSLIGPSGTGKTTLLRMINGLETPTSGKIFFNDLEITSKKVSHSEVCKHIGMVFQHYYLFNHLSVLSNLTVPLVDICGMPKNEAIRKAEKILASFDLLSHKDQMPADLSGGQRQRVAIARTLCMDPEVILFDEPTSALDPGMSLEVQRIIQTYANEDRMVIIVTHDLSFAESVSDEVIFIAEGGVAESGPPEQIFHHPGNPQTRVFIEQLKCFEIVSNNTDFSFESGIQALDDYASQQEVDFRSYNLIMAAMEELLDHTLCSEPKEIQFCFRVIYKPEEKLLACRLQYSGPKKMLLDEEDELSIRLIRGRAKGMQYSYNQTKNLPNDLRFLLV